MRNIFKGLGILLVLFFGISIYNYLTFKSPAKNIQAAEVVYTEIDSAAALQRLSAVLQFQTISHKAEMRDTAAFGGFIAFVAKAFPVVFSKARVDTFHHYTYMLRIEGKDASLAPVVFLGHYDVVPVEHSSLDQWEAPPFSGTIKNNFIYGRGTLDDKGSLMAQLEALESLLVKGFEPQRSLYLCLLHDEEIGGQEGAVQIVNHLKEQGIQPAMVLDEGGFLVEELIPGISKPVALVGTAEKGYLSLEIKVQGVGGHSSMPEKANTIAQLAEVVHKIENHPFPYEITPPIAGFFEYTGPHMQALPKWALANRRLLKPLIFKFFGNSKSGAALLRTTQVPTIISSGMRDNVVPNRGVVTYNFRLLPGYDADRVISHLQSVIDDSTVMISQIEGTPYEKGSAVSPHNHEAFEKLTSSIQASFEDAVVAPYLVLAATDSRHFAPVSTQIYRFTPFKLVSDDLQRIHGINERLSVSAYLKGIQFYSQTMHDFCK